MLRDTNRTTQLKLRDIEVANDDIERQARNTSSSLEDLESKYNVAIERAVMLEAEIQVGEQEREALRIEAQRLRDELSDLRIEAEITQEKLRRMEFAAAAAGNPPLRPLPTKTPDRPRTSPSEPSPASSASSPTRSTPPPPKSSTTSVSDVPTPPSPPISETSINAVSTLKTPNKFSKPKLPSDDSDATPRPQFQQRLPRLSYGQQSSMAEGDIASAVPRRISSVRPMGTPSTRLPPSSSLRQIRGLIGQMQRLEQRVHSARSKLPGSALSPLGASSSDSRQSSEHEAIPASITVRSHKKRTGGSIAGNGSISMAGGTTPLSTSRLSRPSFGFATSHQGDVVNSRPDSRASISSRTSVPYHAAPTFQRPSSRASITGTRTPLGHYSTGCHYAIGPIGEARRPRSSIGGSYTAVHGHAHGHAMSVGGLEEKPLGFSTPTPRRSTLNKPDAHHTSGIPTPSGLSKRQSGALRPAEPTTTTTPRPRKATSQGVFSAPPDREMGPPERKKKLSGVGEV